ncbi:MAG: 3-hydroxyacyl-ACP dehydratase FabZ [Acidimicrobiia bacterium]
MKEKLSVLENSDELVSLLPHGEPFIFVNRVHSLVDDETITASYDVTGDEYFFKGHFPGNPIMPGVLQLEALAQAGAIALLSQDRYKDKLPLFGGAEKVRWRRIVKPGDVLTLEVTLERTSARGGWGAAQAHVNGETSCVARIFFALADK